MLKPYVESARNFLRKPHTIQYPEEKPPIPENFLGRIILEYDVCISCGACERICPNRICYLVGEGKRPEINFERCYFCNLCVEVCPVHCLHMTKEFALASDDRKKFIYSPEQLGVRND